MQIIYKIPIHLECVSVLLQNNFVLTQMFVHSILYFNILWYLF